MPTHIRDSTWLIDGERVHIGRLLEERNNLRAEIERLRAKIEVLAHTIKTREDLISMLRAEIELVSK